MVKKINSIRAIFKKMIKVLLNDEIYASTAHLSYSLIMAIIPLIMFTITIASRLTLPVQDIYNYLHFILPTKAFMTVESIMLEILNSSDLTVVTLLPAIYFISIGTRAFMKVTNKAYHIVENRSLIRYWITSFVFAVLLVCVIIVSLGAVVFGRLILDFLFDLFSIHLWTLLIYMRYIITFFLMGMVICIIYMAAPGVHLHLKDVYIGGYAAALFWTLGSSAFGYYINNFSDYGLLFGSLGGIFILLGWIYWTSLILLLGVYFNASIYYFKHDQNKILKN